MKTARTTQLKKRRSKKTPARAYRSTRAASALAPLRAAAVQRLWRAAATSAADAAASLARRILR